MDEETASVIQHSARLATWAAEQVVETDKLIALCRVRPLSPFEQGLNLQMQRELLVRLSQRDTLAEAMLERQRAGLVERVWAALVRHARRGQGSR
jgi:hypothetical protein